MFDAIKGLMSNLKQMLLLSWNKFVTSDLTGVGTFLGGAATFFASVWGSFAFSLYKKQKHADAEFLQRQQRAEIAGVILCLFQEYRDYIGEIILTPDLYQYENYYPFSHPEIRTVEAKCYTERPSRLIFNKHKIFTKEVSIQICKFGGLEAKELFKALGALEGITKSLKGRFGVDFGTLAHKDKSDAMLQFPDYEMLRAEIDLVLAQVKNVLDPVIYQNPKL